MKKIMFNDDYDLTNAVLKRLKPMTRRICKEYATQLPILSRDVESFRFYPDENIVEFLMLDGTTKVSVPPYKNNEVVAVAQSYENVHDYYFDNEDDDEHVIELLDYYLTPGWSNKMFVRPDLMPHQIQITDFNIERLQDISEEDCMREGIKKSMWMNISGKQLYGFGTNEDKWTSPREAFAALINRPGVGHKGLWEENPYNFAYTFKLIK